MWHLAKCLVSTQSSSSLIVTTGARTCWMARLSSASGFGVPSAELASIRGVRASVRSGGVGRWWFGLRRGVDCRVSRRRVLASSHILVKQIDLGSIVDLLLIYPFALGARSAAAQRSLSTGWLELAVYRAAVGTPYNTLAGHHGLRSLHSRAGRAGPGHPGRRGPRARARSGRRRSRSGTGGTCTGPRCGAPRTRFKFTLILH